MNFYIVMSTIIVIGGAISAFFFRKGGVYNREIPSLDHIDEITLSTPESKEVSTPTATKPVEAPAAPSEPMLDTFCKAIRDFEGVPGDLNYRNCNPGNCRCSPVGYLPKYGNVKCSPGGFAIFPTYELGWEYLQALVHHRAELHPEWTVLDFFKVYAPAGDNNPTEKYAKYVAARCGVIPTTKLKDLFA